MRAFIIFSALAALAAAQDGYSYGAPEETGYDYKEPTSPLGAGNNPGGAVVKPPGDEDHHHGSDDPLQWLRDSVPGEPGVDYPIYATIPPTSFTCDGRVAGYYADVEAGCQPFHVCSPLMGDESMMLSFLCPNGTIFNQEGFACQWWSDVDCAASEQFYDKNEEIGVVPESAASNNVGSVVSGPSSSQPETGYSQPQPQPQPQQPQTSYGQPQQPTQRPRPQPRPQTQRPRPQPRPQTQRPRPQPRPQARPQPRPQAARPQPQVRPVPNQYIPPTTTTTTTTVRPPPGLYNLPRN